MKRSKDEDKDVMVMVAGTVAVASSKLNSNAAANTSSDANNGTAGTVRTTGRVKKPKLVYDPSDNYISRGSRSSLPAPVAVAAAAAAAAAIAVPAPVAVPTAAVPTTNTSTSPATSPPQSNINLSAHINATETVVTPLAASSASEDAAADASVMPGAELLRNYDTCIKCHKSEPKRGSGYKSNFLACKACTLKWHFSCLPITFEILTNARKRYKCEKCRRCRVCVTIKNSDKLKDLIMCCVCANVFHLECHWPRVLAIKRNDPSWKCYSCDPGYNSLDTEDDVAEIETQSTPRKTKAGRKKRATSDPVDLVPAKKQLLNKMENDCDVDGAENKTTSIIPTTAVALVETVSVSNDIATQETPKSQPQSPQSLPATLELPIPAPTTENKENGELVRQAIVAQKSDNLKQPVHNWNVDQVVKYVAKFYPQQSNVFKCQEIDGAALMVLTRQDIIDRFGLKLGPALRLYELILSLQSSSDDVFLGWCD